MKKLAVCIFVLLTFLAILPFSVFAAQEAESNDTFQTATTINVNTDVSGKIATNKDVDWYKFTVSQDGYFNVSFSHELVDSTRRYWLVRLYDSTGASYIDGVNTYFGFVGNANDKTNTFGIKAGTYYIKINSDYHSDLEYVIKVNFTASSAWETENNNAKADADVISVNKTYGGSLSTNGDTDWYKFTVDKAGYFRVKFEHELVDATRRYWLVRLYDSTGVNFIDGVNTYFGFVGNANGETNSFGVEAGTYYIKINQDYHIGMDYSFTVEFTPSNTWETENNNTKDTADVISLNKAYGASLSTDGDIDWYKFTVTENGYFYVDLEHELVDSTRRYWQLRLYDSTAVNYIDSVNTYFGFVGNANDKTTVFGVCPGTYFIKITDDYHIGLDYSIKVNFVAASDWETENNNSKDNADVIKMNTPINATLSTDGDIDWYKFTVDKQTDISVSIKHASLDKSSRYWVGTLYDSSGVTKLTTFYGYGNVTSNSSDYVSVPAGTYYFKVTDDYHTSIQYSIVLHEKHDCKGEFVVTKEPTCTAEGKKEKSCTLCGRVIETENIPATGHSYGAWKVDVAATCTKEGKQHAECTVCAAPTSESIPVIAHNMGEWTVTKAATCTEVGTQTRTCADCNFTENGEIEALGHKFGEWEVYEKPDCYSWGWDRRYCSVCNEHDSRDVDPTDHDLTEWKTVSGSIFFPPIVKEQHCNNCDDVYTEKDWGFVWVPIVSVIVLIGVAYGVYTYFKAFKNN